MDVQIARKLSTLAWWGDVTLGADLGIEDATADEAYAAMDWLAARQDAIEARLAAGTWPRRRTHPEWRCSTCRPPGWRGRTARSARGHSRDGKKGNVQIKYGLLTDPEGRPVAVRVFEENTAGPGRVHPDPGHGARHLRAA